jgi:sRNA-binding protein
METFGADAMNQQRHQAALALIGKLAERFPAAFVINPRCRRPLKLGIHHDILAQLGDTITPRGLSDALRVYASNPHYRKACVSGAARIDLNGQPVGTVSEEHAAVAQAMRKGWYDKRKAKQEQNQTTETGKLEFHPTETVSAPRRLSLSDLRTAAQARKVA